MTEAIDKAVDFLRELLATGPITTNVVGMRAKDAGFSWATIRRAKEQLGILSVRKSDGGDGEGQWLWTLPQGDPNQGSQGAHEQEAQSQDAQTQDAQAQRRTRVITVRGRGVQPEGPDELSYEQWEELGRELGRDCPRVREFLRQRAAPPADHLLS